MAFWRSDWTVQDALGRAVPNATVYWVQQPATTNVVPPSPLVSLYTSTSGSTPLTNPQTTNGFGQASAYMAEGIYTVVEVWNGIVQQIYPDQAVGITAGGTVISVGMTVPSFLSVSGSPVTTSGTFAVTLANQNANTIFAGPSSGAAGVPSFRNLVIADLPLGAGGFNVIDPVQTQGVSLANTFTLPYAGAINATQNTLTITPGAGIANLTTAMQTYQCVVAGAGAGGLDLYTTITTTTSSTTATLSAAASTTVTNAFVWIFPNGMDVTAQLQAAVNSTTSATGNVYLRQGVWPISSSIAASNLLLQIQGDGMANTWVIANSAAFVGNIIDLSQLTGKPTGLTFKDFSIKGPGLVVPSHVTAVAVTSNVVTVTCVNSFTTNEVVIVQGLSGIALGNNLNDAFLTVTGSNGTSFTAAFTNANVVTTSTDGYAYPLHQCGLELVKQVREYDIQNMFILSNPGAGVQVTEGIVCGMRRVVSQGNATGFNILSPNTPAGTPGATSLHFDHCYGNGNYLANYYVRTGAYVAFNGCASDNGGTGYYLYTSPGVTLNGCGCEASVFRSSSFNGDFYLVRGGPGTVLNGCYYNVSGANVSGQVALHGISATQMTVIGLRAVLTSGSTQLTNEMLLDSGCTNCFILNPTFKSSTAWTDLGTNDTVVINGVYQTILQTNNIVQEGTPWPINSPADVTGNWSISGWGSGASVSSVGAGSNLAGGKVFILCGSGPSANPTITWTYPVDTKLFTVNPAIVVTNAGASAPLTAQWVQTAQSTTQATWTYVGTPVNASTYAMAWILQGRG